MTGRWARAVTLLVGVAATTGACSGSDGATPATPLESAEPITAPPSTDAEVSTTVTTEPSASTTTSTSTIATTTTTTEPAPTTTTLDDLRAEIEADLNEGEQAFLQGASTPDDPDSVATLEKYFAGPSLEAVVSAYESLASSNHVAARNPVVPSTNVVMEVLSTDLDTAVVRKCRIDAGIVQTRSGEVIDDQVVRYTSLSDVVLVDGVWLLSGGDTLTTEIGPRTCDDL